VEIGWGVDVKVGGEGVTMGEVMGEVRVKVWGGLGDWVGVR